MNEVSFAMLVVMAAAMTATAMGWRHRRWQRRMRRAQGVVVDQIEAGEAHPFFYAVVEFIDAGGQRVRFTDRFGHGGEPLFPVGAAVSVDYSRSDPAQAYIHGIRISRRLAVAVVITGLLLVILGLHAQG